MEKPTPRPEPMYPGKVTDENIRKIFAGAADFLAREIGCGEQKLYAYAIDGLISGGDMSDYVLKPIAELLGNGDMAELYRKALRGTVYNAVADTAEDLDGIALKLVSTLHGVALDVIDNPISISVTLNAFV